MSDVGELSARRFPIDVWRDASVKFIEALVMIFHSPIQVKSPINAKGTAFWGNP